MLHLTSEAPRTRNEPASLDRLVLVLELMPLRMNEQKNAKIGQRQRALAAKLREAGLLGTKNQL